MSAKKSTATKQAATKKTTAKKTTPGNLTAPPPTQITDVAEIKRRAQGELLQLPSGVVMRCRRVDLQTFVRQGSVPNALMEIVDEAVNKGKKVNLEEAVQPENLDNDTLMEMFDLVEEVVTKVVIEPKIHKMPTVEELEAHNAENPDEQIYDLQELKSDDLLYIDEVDAEDKMFLFQWASGGTSDVAQFRIEAEADMATVAQMQGARTATK